MEITAHQMTQTKTKTKSETTIRLKDGGWYRTAAGYIVQVRKLSSKAYCGDTFADPLEMRLVVPEKKGVSYFEDGHFLGTATRNSPWNITKEINAQDRTALESRTTEHEKLQALNGKNEACGNFLEWLQNTKKFTLAQYHNHSDSCWEYGTAEPPKSRYGDAGPRPIRNALLHYKDEKKLTCGMDEDERLEPVYTSVHDLLAEFFGIDQRKLDEEKRFILDQLRKMQANDQNPT